MSESPSSRIPSRTLPTNHPSSCDMSRGRRNILITTFFTEQTKHRQRCVQFSRQSERRLLQRSWPERHAHSHYCRSFNFILASLTILAHRTLSSAILFVSCSGEPPIGRKPTDLSCCFTSSKRTKSFKM